jgi:glycosyltransferase involved in cell wall biosynthesis
MADLVKAIRNKVNRPKPGIIVHTPEPVSSPALYIEQFCLALANQGITLGLVCPKNLKTRSALEQNPLIHVYPTATRSTDRTRGFIRKAIGNLWFVHSSLWILSRTCGRDTIVHIQYALHFPLGILFFLVAHLRGSAIVFTVHDPLPHKWLPAGYLRLIEQQSLAWAYRLSRELVVHSEAGKQTLIKYFRIKADKICVIPHGPYSLGLGILPMPQSEYLEVLLFGALRENKGAHLAIEAVQQLFREGVKIRLTIAGAVLNCNEQPWWSNCRELIAAYPEPIRVIEDFIADEKLPQLLGNCHCMLLPYTSFFSDSGVAFMALANGRPIIATRVGGLSALLDSSGGGFAIEEPTVSGVVEALRKASDLGLSCLKSMGVTGTARVMTECGWPIVADGTRRLYDSILADIRS